MKTTREKYDKSVFGDFPAPTSLEKVFCKKSMEQLKKGIIRSIRCCLKIDDKLVMFCEIGIYAIFV